MCGEGDDVVRLGEAVHALGVGRRGAPERSDQRRERHLLPLAVAARGAAAPAATRGAAAVEQQPALVEHAAPWRRAREAQELLA